jgi:hypothetical protein
LDRALSGRGELPCKDALLDGEITFVLPTGLTSFKVLQEHIDSPHQAIRYFIFDLLELNGKNWSKRPLIERKARLAALLGGKDLPERLVYSDQMQASGPAFIESACKAGLEGIVSKRADTPYRSGRTKDWLKFKCGQHAEFVIGGYSRSTTRRTSFRLPPARHFRGWQAHLCRQSGHGRQRGRSRRPRQALQAASAQDLALHRGARGGAAGRGVARTRARCRGCLC